MGYPVQRMPPSPPLRAIEWRCLVCRRGSSDKVYHILVVERGQGRFAVIAAWGRRGAAAPSWQFKADGLARGPASAVLADLAREKIGRGYSVAANRQALPAGFLLAVGSPDHVPATDVPLASPGDKGSRDGRPPDRLSLLEI